MAKDNERLIAQSYYVDHCMTAKEIAAKINVSEKTIGKWKDAGNWHEIRIAKQSSNDVLVAKYKELQASLLDKRLTFERKSSKTEEEKEEHRNIIDEMSKIAAMIDRCQADGKVSLRVHVHCMEKFMGALHQRNSKLFMELVEFQKDYLTLLAEELK